MKQENIKKVMEQIRSKKNVANELAAMAEVNVNVATMAAAQAEGGEIVERTISVPANAVELAVYSADAIGVEGNFYSDEEGWVGYYYPNQTYYYTICRVKAEEVGISEDAFKDGKLWLTFSNESSGMKVFEIYNSNGDYVCDWGYEIPVAEVFNEATKQAEFMVVPSMGCTGSILFTKSDFSIAYNEVVTLQSISVTTPPTKTEYVVGETFDPAGMVVTATYSDRLPSAVTNYTYTPSGALALDDERITISYTESGVTRTATQAITVDNAGSEEDPVILTGIEITTPPTKTEYVVGETFASAGMRVTATYSDGSTAEVSGYTYSPTGALTANDTSIMISYTEAGVTKMATQAITVNNDNAGSEEDPVTLTGIEITTLPTKTEYVVGETFDPAGMVVMGVYSDESMNPVSGYTMSVSGFNSDNATDSQTVTISVSWNGFTANRSMQIAVYPTEEVDYVGEENDKQKMDIHMPKNADGTYKAGSFPVVITIHGGGWSAGDKDEYDYMTGFITNTCNCVHVNMNYRLTTGDPSNNGITYVQMLEDIQFVIGYLQAHADVYHVDASKIALMGYSAGAHLAMLYAYKAANGELPYGDKIQLVVSEAGPTYFSEEVLASFLQWVANEVLAMLGSASDDNMLSQKLVYASPCTYANGNLPFTIYARGVNDILVQVDQPISLVKELLPAYVNVADSIIEQALRSNSLTNQANCAFFSFDGYEHNSFGVDKDINGDNILDPGINPSNAECSAYYNAVETKLKNL